MQGFTERQITVLNAVQRSFPLTARPFLELEKEISIPETELIDTVRALKNDGVIRNIAGIFNGESLGYSLSLVAFSVPDDRVETAAAIINTHPGVSHNYLRGHHYNIWFTLAEDTPENFRKSVDILARRTGAESHLVLRNERLYKIGFRLAIGDEEPLPQAENQAPRVFTGILGDGEKRAVYLLQQDMPLTEHPFAELAATGSLTEDQRISIAASLLEKGVMRRYSAVLRHQRAGYRHNAMTAWKFPEGCDIDASVSHFAAEQAVTHLYTRTLYPGQWEYPLFAMIHARSEDGLNGIINRLSEVSGLTDRLVLRSIKEFKKQKVMYYSPDFQKWKDVNYD
jgi:DNA-binding Lrp family transcriptional regulator